MSNPIPQTLVNFRVYLDGRDLLGVADVELPELEAVTEEIKGAGLAGVVDTPITGHMAAMTLSLSWRTITGNVITLAQIKAHQLDLRGSVQVYDTASGEYKTQAVKAVVKAIPKKTSLGKLDSGKAMETKNEFEVVYLKLSIEDSEVMEIDKLNYICKIDGVDYLEQVRGDLGL